MDTQVSGFEFEFQQFCFLCPLWGLIYLDSLKSIILSWIFVHLVDQIDVKKQKCLRGHDLPVKFTCDTGLQTFELMFP